MKGVAPRVARAFERLRGESAGRIYLKRINGKHYVYRESGTWDRELKRARVRSEYLGRILEDGTYIRKIASYTDELERAKALILERGGRVIWPERKEGPALPEPASMSASETDMRLLTALSMNARASFAQMGRLAGLSPSAAYARVKNLEKRYGIRYMAEIDLDKLGYLTHLVLVKFQKEVPSLENLKAAVKKDPRIQLAFLTKGEYDLVIFLLTEAGEVGRFSLRKQRDILFPEYDAKWDRAPVYITYSFVPLREEFFEVLKSRVWKRSKETPRPSEGSISHGEYCVLYELVKNGAMDFSEIDRKYGFDKGMAQYAYHKLKEKQIIKRVTMSMTNFPVKYLVFIYLENINDKKWEEVKPRLLAHIIREMNVPTDLYALVGDAGTPEGSIFIVPIFNEADFGKEEEVLKSIVTGARVTTSIITNSLVNAPCFRKFDKTYSKQHNRLVESHGLKSPSKIIYE
jgi:DNA-binding Lrp family transcriptional regulator